MRMKAWGNQDELGQTIFWRMTERANGSIEVEARHEEDTDSFWWSVLELNYDGTLYLHEDVGISSHLKTDSRRRIVVVGDLP